jgi:hypothetical protein
MVPLHEKLQESVPGKIIASVLHFDAAPAQVQAVGRQIAAKGDQNEKERIFDGWHLVALFVAVVRMWGYTNS